MSASFTLRAPAKVNPVLEVLGKRPDGFHELALIFQAVGLYDELTFTPGQTFGFEIAGVPAPLAADDSNLVVKAAQLFFRDVLKRDGGVHIQLEKRIPLAAGLGGGSSDAAATLLGLDRYFDTGWGAAKLQPLAAQLGSDVPFFLHGGTALGTGRGEKITSLAPMREIWLVLVKPSEGLSTPAVYRSGKAAFTSGEKARGFQALAPNLDATGLSQVLFNGLEPAAIHLMPLIGEVRQALLEAGALGAMVSGSGPTVFGVAKDRSSAENIRARLEGRGWGLFTVPTLASGIE